MTTALFLILIASKLTAAVPAEGPFRVAPPAWRVTNASRESRASSTPDMKAASVTAAYAVFYPRMCEAARLNGYALAMHGTMCRDCDLVAAPWTDSAVDALTLVKALREAIGGVWWHPETDHWYPSGSPNLKPHGRVAWSIHLTDRGSEGPYFDVSVMPRHDTRTFDQGEGI